MKSVKAWYLLHKWTSLVSTLFLLMLCLTGLPLIFHHEIDHALGYSVDAPLLSDVGTPAGLDDMIADAQRRTPGSVVQFILGDPEEPDLLYIRLGETIDADEIAAFYTYDARTGAMLQAYPLNQGVMNVLLRLHVDMFAGLPGMLFLGFMGLLLVASLISGAVLYGPYMRKLAFGTVRRHRSPRLKWLDVHNLLGIVTLAWLFVVGVTGVINTLAIPIFDHWKTTELAAMTAPYKHLSAVESGSAERALAAARAAAPDQRLSFMAFPGNGFASPRHFVAYMQGTTPWTAKLLTPMLIDGQAGEVLARRELPWYTTALLLSQPLHFGDYGGWPLKVLWALLDVLCIVVLVSGLYLWVKRRRLSFEAWMQAMQAGAAREDEVAPV